MNPLRACAWLLVLGSAGSVQAGLPAGYGHIYLSPHASAEVRQSAQDLASLMERSFGESPMIRREPLLGFSRGIHVGPAPKHPDFDDNPLTDEILVERSPRGLEIRGSDNSATSFAIYRFIEAFLGWRNFHPGELGLERLDPAPATPAATGPRELLLFERAGFHSRNPHPSIGRSGQARDWARWNALRERFVYNHTLHDVLPPAQFDRHPDWFAKDESGQPMRPPFPYPHGYNDHPDLANEAVREWVKDRTITALEVASLSGKPYFRAKGYPPVRFSPGVVATSLSLGDSFIFGEYDDRYAWKPDQYFRRWPDWSNHVFAYTNALAETLNLTWETMSWTDGEKPRLYLGALSYLNWEDTPDFAVHPSIVPYMTFDRSQWCDPQARADDLALVEAWAAKGTRVLGTWDYLFGYGFLMPRSMTTIVSDSIPALHARGVRAYFCQVAPLWPYDAHTTWLAAKLLWNPAADADALLEEFHTAYFGPAAGPMRGFFNLAESVWMGQTGRGWWLRYWKDPWQAALWTTEMLDELEGCLDSALAMARVHEARPEQAGLRSTRFQERIRQIADLFSATRLFVEYESKAWELQSVRWEAADPAALKDGLTRAGDSLRARSRLVQTVREVVARHPLAARAGDLQWILLYDNLGGSLAALAHRCAQVADEPARKEAMDLLAEWNRLEGLEGRPEFSRARSNLFDSEFEHVRNPQIWHRQFLDSEGLEMRPAETGNGFVAKAVRRGHIFQLFAPKAGHFYLGTLDLETNLPDSGEIYIRLDFYNESHELLAQSRHARLAPVGRFGRNQRIRVLSQAPAGCAYGRIFIRFYEMDPQSRAFLGAVDVLDLGSGTNP